jgi:hypothetical protein
MMGGVRLDERSPGGAGQLRRGVDLDGVHAFPARVIGIVVKRSRTLAWNVLDERSAERDVHDLSAATNSQRRNGTVPSLARESELVGVSGGVRRSGSRVRRDSVVGRIEIFAAGEHESRYSV